MNLFVLLALAIAPGVAISIFIYWKDKFDREPRRLLIISFFLGMIAIIPALFLEVLGSNFAMQGGSTISTLIYAFGVVGVSEEFCKFLMLRGFAYPKKEFNEPFDGITYSVMVSMGFATLENIMYVTEGGVGNAFLRMFTAVPAHATFGVIMGYYAGLAKFRGDPETLLFQGFLLAAMMHGAYDFCLMEQNIPMIAIGAMVSLYLGIRYSLRAIRLHQQHSPFNV